MSGSPHPSPGDLPNPGIELGSPALWVDSLPAELLRESFPRQVDKKSRVPQGERGLEFSRRRKDKLFPLYIA